MASRLPGANSVFPNLPRNPLQSACRSHDMRTYQTARSHFASMSFLRRTIVTLSRRMRILLPLRRRRSRSRFLLVPIVEFLLLILLLFIVPCPHRRGRLSQRVRPLLLRLPTLTRNPRRLSIAAFGFGLRALLRLRSSLLLPHPRLRFGLIVPCVRLSKRTEPILRLRRSRGLVSGHRPPGCFLPHQCSLA